MSSIKKKVETLIEEARVAIKRLEGAYHYGGGNPNYQIAIHNLRKAIVQVEHDLYIGESTPEWPKSEQAERKRLFQVSRWTGEDLDVEFVVGYDTEQSFQSKTHVIPLNAHYAYVSVVAEIANEWWTHTSARLKGAVE